MHSRIQAISYPTPTLFPAFLEKIGQNLEFYLEMFIYEWFFYGTDHIAFEDKIVLSSHNEWKRKEPQHLPCIESPKAGCLL